MDRLELRLRRMVFAYWGLPKGLGYKLVYLLLRSDASRAREFRLQFAASPESQLSQIFRDTFTPKVAMELIRDLYAMNRLSSREASILEECILATTSATGEWKAV